MQTMDHLRTEIWDHLYRSGPQTIDQLADKLRLNTVSVSSVIDHEWFEIQGVTVLIATGGPKSVDRESGE